MMVQESRKERIELKTRNDVLTTKEACRFLRISRPTYLKLIYNHHIRAKKVGRGWKVLMSELQAYLNGKQE